MNGFAGNVSNTTVDVLLKLLFDGGFVVRKLLRVWQNCRSTRHRQVPFRLGISIGTLAFQRLWLARTVFSALMARVRAHIHTISHVYIYSCMPLKGTQVSFVWLLLFRLMAIAFGKYTTRKTTTCLSPASRSSGEDFVDAAPKLNYKLQRSTQGD